MVPKIPGRERIEYVFRKGSRNRGSLFSLRLIPNRAGSLRFCVMVSKRISDKAVTRNRIRRRMYEAIRLSLSNLPKIGYDVGVLVTKNVQHAPFENLKKEIASSLGSLCDLRSLPRRWRGS